MAQSDPAEILLIHHRWANERILAACDGLTDAQLDREFAIGVVSLRKTLAHIASTIRGWDDLLAGRAKRPWLDANGYSLAQLCELFDRVTSDFETTARKHPHHEIVTGGEPGKTYSFTRGGILAHLLVHAVHHRAQCLNILRHLGVDPLPECDVDVWMVTEDPVSFPAG